MKKLWSGLLALALLAAGPQDKEKRPDRGRTPELTKKFNEYMDQNSKKIKALKDDIEKDKPEAELKKHLVKIREILAKARDLKYRKDEEDAERLEGHFDIFDLKIKADFEAVPWDTKENRLSLLERLKIKCDVCHDDRLRE